MRCGLAGGVSEGMIFIFFLIKPLCQCLSKTITV